MADANEPPPASKLTRSKERWAREGRFLTGKPARPEEQRLPPGQHLTRDWPVLDLGLTSDISRARWRLDDNTGAPAGFANSLKCTVGTGAAVAAGHYLIIEAPIEASQLTRAALGTAPDRATGLAPMPPPGRPGTGEGAPGLPGGDTGRVIPGWGFVPVREAGAGRPRGLAGAFRWPGRCRWRGPGRAVRRTRVG